MERAPGFIGTAGVPLVRQANISCLAELTPHPVSIKRWLRFSGWGVQFAQITYVVRHRTLADFRKLCAH